MKVIGNGFAALQQTCARLKIVADFGPAAATVPDTLLGAPLDPELRALYLAHDGIRWSASDFYLRIYPLTGPDAIEWRNISQRRSPDDYVPPYPFDSIIVFAQYGLRASYLATIPVLADKTGHQPVLYVDAHETVWAVPIASSVDRAFALISSYLEGAIAQYGRSGLVEAQFPLGMPRLVASDTALVARIKAGVFSKWIGEDVFVQGWIDTMSSK